MAVFLSPSELLWLGLDNGRADALRAWGAPGGSRLGCLCLQVVDRRPWESFAGRQNAGMIASAFPDLNFRLAELLTDLHMPAALLGPVLASATLDFVNTVSSRDADDCRGLVEFVQTLRIERVELYLGLLTTDGPLVPIGETPGGEGPRHRRIRRIDPECHEGTPMKAVWFSTFASALALTMAASAGQAPAIRITSPTRDSVVSGTTRLEVVIEPQDVVPTVKTVTFWIDGRLACTIERPPFACAWDAG